MTSVASAAAQPPAIPDGGGIAAPGFLSLPSRLDGFVQTGEPREDVRTEEFGTSDKGCRRPARVLTVPGVLAAGDAPACPRCGKAMEGNGKAPVTLWHLPLGMERARVEVSRRRWACRDCGRTSVEDVPFKAPGHRITRPLLAFVQDLLALGQTLKAVSLMTGLHKNVVKQIDRARLEALYTREDGDGVRRLGKPGRQARYLGIDEFKLHGGRRYATVIIDLGTGHVLWLAHSKRKQVVYDFCDHVGKEWMSRVEAVACDMNADFERAFLERHPHLDIVYDRFHIVKNFNEKVISEVRKDEQARLRDEGDHEAARALKRSKYILMSGEDTRCVCSIGSGPVEHLELVHVSGWF
ncbi:transposase [Pseudoscardovia suis]|uniref:transposase n=1 Tax=Pseudoscardovia suis TaxID=987063 RepID=UPI003F9C81FB